MRAWTFLGGVVILSVAVAAIQTRRPAIAGLANRFLNSLTADQRAKAVKNFRNDYRTNWRFVPASRDGINFGDLTPEQAENASSLLKASLSDAGYKRVETIKGLEDVLYELENRNAGRDKRLYTFTFFGEPSPNSEWGWRYEGHHVSLNFTFKNGELVSSTPQFFGANPAEVRSGPKKGLRALPQEQDLGFALLDSLSPDQQAKAVIGSQAPGDIVTGNARKAAIQAKAGIRFSDLDKKQKEVLLQLVKVYVESQNEQEAKRRMGRVDRDSLVFAWMGSTKPGRGHYYRIQGSKFLIEYDNTQNDANHIHSVWRDFDGDFGEDVLAEHYRVAHQDRH